MTRSRYPLLYQVNTRTWLTERGRQLGRHATLDDVTAADVSLWAEQGFEWIWLLGVWQTGPAGQRISRQQPDWRREFEETLPDLTEEDIGGSCFAIAAYEVARELGGADALVRLRARLAGVGVRLMLDFVPNHLAPDHPWVSAHPEYFIQGTAEDLERTPQNYFRPAPDGPVFAHGRDPYFPGWPDTIQLNYGRPEVRAALQAELVRIATQCDGVRCDMAMLILPDIFERTWGISMAPFWPDAVAAVRRGNPEFFFLAEVYWDLEWTLQQQGFNACYDKRLYDRLREGAAGPVRDHLKAGLDYQDRLARFLENHDEPRVAATFAEGPHQAAAVISFLSSGLRFFHQGQLEGCQRRVSPHLIRTPQEPVSTVLAEFYGRLLQALRSPVVRNGQWALLEVGPAWDGNPTAGEFLAFSWTSDDGARRLVVVNYSAHPAQAYVRWPWPDARESHWRLTDQLGPEVYDRPAIGLLDYGLYLDAPAWQAHLFEVTQLS